MNIIDKETGEVIGTVHTNHRLTLEQAMELAGFEWKTLKDDGVECDGFYKNDVLYDESVAELVD